MENGSKNIQEKNKGEKKSEFQFYVSV